MAERLRVSVARMAAEGQGIAKEAGSDRVIFVPYAVPGDQLEVELTEVKKGFAKGRITRLLAPGPDRQSPPCNLHFAPGTSAFCGGCDWQQFTYEAALRRKREIVVDCLKRIGRLEPEVLPTLPSPHTSRYRNKVQVPFGWQGRVVAGFYRPGSHDIVDFDDCLVQPELSVRIIRKVKEMAGPLGWKPYDSRTHTGWLRHLFVRTNSEGKALVAFVTRNPDFRNEDKAVAELTALFPEIVSLQQNVQMEKTSVILGPRWRRLWGRDYLEEKVGPVRLSASPGAFLQVNTGATERLYGAAQDLLLSEDFRPDTLLDLYSGVGAIALWLAPKVGKVIGVEEVADAVQDAIGNAKRNGIRNARFIRSTAEAWFRSRQAAELGGDCAAVIDPPRAGCELHVLRGLARSGVARIVYVSCNPATFARDAALLTGSGFRLRRVQPVDLFPQTSHVELAGLFERSEGRTR